jgi:hypothetical protein
MVHRAAAQLTAAAMEAVRTLVALQDVAMPPAVRLGAARSILEIGTKLREAAEYEARLAALEQRIAAGLSNARYTRNVAYPDYPVESPAEVTFDSWSADMLARLEGRSASDLKIDYPEELVKNPELYASDESLFPQKDERLATRRLTDDANDPDEKFQNFVDAGLEYVRDFELGMRYGQNQRYQLEPGRETSTTITGIRDTEAGELRRGKPVGDWLVPVDGPHENAPEPHFNYNPELTGIDDPHYQRGYVRGIGQIRKVS